MLEPDYNMCSGLSQIEVTFKTVFLKSVKRARQNVVLEMGFFIDSLGRERVCAIYRKSVEIPSDITRVLYEI